MMQELDRKCIKCDGKLMYLKSFKANFVITCNDYVMDHDIIQFYWVCSSCSRLHTNSLEYPEMKLYDITT